jgi:hypothetical protein
MKYPLTLLTLKLVYDRFYASSYYPWAHESPEQQKSRLSHLRHKPYDQWSDEECLRNPEQVVI